MGDPNRRVELRVAKLEKTTADQQAKIERMQQTIGAVAEASGSALALEALTELVGIPAFESKMREITKRKQTEAEAHMAGQVNDAVEQGKLRAVEVVVKGSLVVGQRTEGPEGKVSYRVDLYPAPEAYLGKKAGEVVEDGTTKTEIREVYEVVKEQPKAEAAGEPSQDQTAGG